MLKGEREKERRNTNAGFSASINKKIVINTNTNKYIL
jgi:hypothetical protein